MESATRVRIEFAQPCFHGLNFLSEFADLLTWFFNRQLLFILENLEQSVINGDVKLTYLTFLLVVASLMLTDLSLED